jgi:hypothetical protein
MLMYCIKYSKVMNNIIELSGLFDVDISVSRIITNMLNQFS